MEKFDYQTLQQEVAIPLIRKFGVDVDMYRTEDVAPYEERYDPITMSKYWMDTVTDTRYDEKPEATQVEYPCLGIIQGFDVEQIDGTLIKENDVMLILVGDDVTIPQPQLGDIFDVGGTEYQFVRLRRMAPSNWDILYKIQVRS